MECRFRKCFRSDFFRFIGIERTNKTRLLGQKVKVGLQNVRGRENLLWFYFDLSKEWNEIQRYF